jgi:AP-3 complex subunit beta
MSEGHDVSEFTSFAAQLIASTDPENRQLAHVFLTHYAQQQPDAMILSINTFQKGLTDPDPMVRASALRALSSARIDDILTAVQSAVANAVGDPSPYVKKSAALAIIKVVDRAPGESDYYLQFVERLLSDGSVIAFSGAIAVYWEICPDNIELLHPRFHFICQNLTKFDEWGQLFAVRAMTVYTRYCFVNPATLPEVEGVGFWEDGGETEQISADHYCLILAIKRLLASPSPAVVLAAVAYLVYCAPASHISAVARPLVRLLYEGDAEAELALATIASIAPSHQHIFLPHLSHFNVRTNDTVSVRQLKLRVLGALVSRSNAPLILAELSNYAASPEQPFAISALRTIAAAALANPPVIPDAVQSLVNLTARIDTRILPALLSAIGEVLREPLGTADEECAIRLLCRRLATLRDARARAAILALIGDVHAAHPQFASDVLRFLARDFSDQPIEVKLAALALAARLVASDATSEIPLFLLRVCARDTEFDIRDRAKVLLALLNAPGDRLHERVRTMLAPRRTAADWPELDTSKEFQIGSLSQFTRRELPGYEALPEWADPRDLPPDTVRQVTKLASTSEPIPGIDDDEEEDDINFNEFFGDEPAPAHRAGDEVGTQEEQEEEDAGVEEEQEEVDDLDHFFD